ncbi:unnamed protein product, partial [Chrysoparadoxa australica]
EEQLTPPSEFEPRPDLEPPKERPYCNNTYPIPGLDHTQSQTRSLLTASLPPPLSRTTIGAEISQDKEEGVSVNAQVWCRDQDLIYEAKVLKAEKLEGVAVRYFVHYKGWNTRYDKWLNAEEVIADEKEATEMKRRLELQSTKILEKAKKEAQDSKVCKAKKQKVDIQLGTEEKSCPAKLKMPITIALKKRLVDDWELITQEPQCLIPLPRKVTVVTVVDEYIANIAQTRKSRKSLKLEDANAQLDRCKELAEGILMYFDTALPLTLLYQQEREQYTKLNAKAPGTRPSEVKSKSNQINSNQVYGPEHLLRLFVKLPGMLEEAALSGEQVAGVSCIGTELALF